MKLLFSSAIALFIAVASTTAFAAGENTLQLTSDGPVVTVNFADLNLANPTDADALLKRIHAAARKVCLHTNAGNSLPALKDRRLCQTESYDSGIAIINSQKGIDVEAIASRANTRRSVVEAN